MQTNAGKAWELPWASYSSSPCATAGAFDCRFRRMAVFRRQLAAGSALAILLAGGVARAAETTPVRLRYTAPAECPDRRGFFEQVSARTKLARLADASEIATTLVVRIKHVPGGTAGTIELSTPPGRTAQREVKAASCEQVVAALALMTALAIDPDASTEPVSKPPLPAPKLEPTAAPKPTRRGTPEERPASALTRWKGGVSVELLGGIAPSLVPAVRPFIELDREGRAPWGFAARLSAARLQTEVRTESGGAEFRLWSARLEGCPAHVRVARPLWFSACLAFDFGELTATGNGVTPAQQVSRPWLAAGEITRLELRLFDALAIEAAGEIMFPLVRDRFFVQTDVTLHRAPAVAGGGAVGVGVTFP